MVRDIVGRLPSGWDGLMLALDPIDDGRKIEIAADLWPPGYYVGETNGDELLRECDGFIEHVLAEPRYTRSDFKRLLNKTKPAWGVPFDIRYERDFLEALREAIKVKLQRK